jgi:hypothetical protein
VVRLLRNLALMSVVAGLVAIGGAAGSANANATSGWIKGVTSAGITYCDEATITTARYAAGYIESNSGSSCGDDYTSPSGYMGVLDDEAFDGSFCGGAPNYLNNDSPKSSFGQGGYWCGDEGEGTYDSFTENQYWYAPADEYYGLPVVTSPGQTTDVVTGGSQQNSNALEGPIPMGDFDGGTLNISTLPKYISVASHGEIVGYVAASAIIVTGGEPVPSVTPVPVYNGALSEIVGHMVPGDGFVPTAGSNLPATFSAGQSPDESTLP